MIVMAAMGATVNNGVVAVRLNQQPRRAAGFSLVAMMLSLASFIPTACYGFGVVVVVPIKHKQMRQLTNHYSKRITSHTTTTTTTTHRTIDSSIPVGGEFMDFATTTTMEQEQDENHGIIGGSIGGSIGGNINIHTHHHSKFPTNELNRVETWCLDRLDRWYTHSERHIKCPFFRRRCGDLLDHAESSVRFFLVRPYCRDSSYRLGPSLSCKPMAGEGGCKTKHLPIDDLLNVLRRDWRVSTMNTNANVNVNVNEKGYYVTGRLSTRIYRNDCEFHSPDPDLPLTGLRKYVGVASQLFDSKASYSKLLSLDLLEGQDEKVTMAEGIIVLKASWKMSITINLPWKPQLPEFSGSTLYFLDEDRLIYRHQETWDISVFDAFLGMMSIKKNNNNNNNLHRRPTALSSPNPQKLSTTSSHATRNSKEVGSSFEGTNMVHAAMVE